MASIPEDPPLTPVPASETESTLKEVLIKMLGSTEGAIVLTPILKSMVLELTNTKVETLDKIVTLLLKILENNKIDIQDVPDFILLFIELNTLYSTLKFQQVTKDDCAVLIKTIAMTLYEMKFKEKFTVEERDLLFEGFDIIVTLVDLSSIVAPVSTGCFFSFCGFGKPATTTPVVPAVKV